MVAGGGGGGGKKKYSVRSLYPRRPRATYRAEDEFVEFSIEFGRNEITKSRAASAV